VSHCRCLQTVCVVLTRDEWKIILHKQVSERRASERKAIEEAAKLDNEEFSPVESEAELTDKESLASDCEKEETEKEIDKETAEISDEEDTGEQNHDEEVEIQHDWQSDSNSINSDDDDDDEDTDDELITKNKKSLKQLDSDSDSEMPSQSTDKPATPVIRNFPFDDKIRASANETSDLSKMMDTNKSMSHGDDDDKKEIDSGIGTSLLAGVSLDVDGIAIDGNTSKDDNVTLIKGVNRKRPSEDDTSMVNIYYLLIQYFTINCCLVIIMLLHNSLIM